MKGGTYFPSSVTGNIPIRITVISIFVVKIFIAFQKPLGRQYLNAHIFTYRLYCLISGYNDFRF